MTTISKFPENKASDSQIQVIKHKGYWTREGVMKDMQSLYIFGDNDAGFGTKGQAVIRNLPNAIGIPTKKYPGRKAMHFYTDDEFKENEKKLAAAFGKCRKRLKTGEFGRFVLPEDGLGTGLAELPTKAPKTYAILQRMLNELVISLSLPSSSSSSSSDISGTPSSAISLRTPDHQSLNVIQSVAVLQ